MVANARKDEPRARSIVAGIELDATADACEPNASALARHCGRSCSCPPADGLAPPLLARTSWWRGFEPLTSAVQAPAKLCSEAKVQVIRSFAFGGLRARPPPIPAVRCAQTAAIPERRVERVNSSHSASATGSGAFLGSITLDKQPGAGRFSCYSARRWKGRPWRVSGN